MKRMACVVALAAGAGLPLATCANSALAAPVSYHNTAGLQISLVAPMIVDGESEINLDLNFRGAKVHSVELYVDNALIKQQTMMTHEGHGNIRFTLDSGLLTEGNHELLVKAFDANGSAATATTRLHIGDGDSNALVRFLYPKRGVTVQGVVPIQITVDSSVRNPFVSFFVDNDFLSLTNYAPFTYNWDSTKVSNGTHKITAIAYDGETSAEVKTVHLQFRVNNPGGFTTRETETPDLGAKKTTPRVDRATPPSVAAAVVHKVELPAEPATLSDVQLVLNTVVPNAPMGRTDVALNAAHHTTFAVPTARPSVWPQPGHSPAKSFAVNRMEALSGPISSPIATEKALAPAVTDLDPTTVTRAGTMRLTPQSGVMGLLSDPAQLTSLVSVSVSRFRLARVDARIRHSGNIAALPGMRMMGAPTLEPNAHVKSTNAPIATPRSETALVGMANLTHLTGKTFDVAFDNTQVAFDVPPRIEHGLALAPFRAIFEHTGGRLEWYGHSKTVRAINETHEIELRIGHENAKVNNQPVKMDAAPYIDHGRTIVPLTFIRDAMDVDVQYDPKTGHLRINSKK